MRQIRPLQTPTTNCIPRIPELLAAGVQVRVALIILQTSVPTTGDLTDEIFTLSAAIRFYHVDILAKLANGTNLNDGDRDIIKQHLKENDPKLLNTNNY